MNRYGVVDECELMTGWVNLIQGHHQSRKKAHDLREQILGEVRGVGHGAVVVWVWW